MGDRYMAVVVRGWGGLYGANGFGERAEMGKGEVEETGGWIKEEEEWAYGRPVAVNRCMASVSCARGAVSVPSSKVSWWLEMEGGLREKMGMIGIIRLGSRRNGVYSRREIADTVQREIGLVENNGVGTIVTVRRVWMMRYVLIVAEMEG